MVKAKTIQIHWHDKQPVYSVDFESVAPGRLGTIDCLDLLIFLATCGADSAVRVKIVQFLIKLDLECEYLQRSDRESY